MAPERLQKLISAAGIASRRHAEDLIREGRVTVNGAKVTELGAKADLAKDHVKVDGKLIRIGAIRHYFLLNKPRGIVVTRDDPQARNTIYTLIGPRLPPGTVPVGRLDADSEGLLILTDDGTLVQKLTHPSGGCKKEYEVKVSGVPTPGQIARLSRGVTIEGTRTAPAEITLTKSTPEKDGVGGNGWLKVVLREGRSRQIRKMFDLVGHSVTKLRRVAIGPLRDRSLPLGGWRELAEEEVRALFAIRPEARPPRPPRSRGRSRTPTTPPAPIAPPSGGEHPRVGPPAWPDRSARPELRRSANVPPRTPAPARPPAARRSPPRKGRR